MGLGGNWEGARGLRPALSLRPGAAALSSSSSAPAFRGSPVVPRGTRGVCSRSDRSRRGGAGPATRLLPRRGGGDRRKSSDSSCPPGRALRRAGRGGGERLGLPPHMCVCAPRCACVFPDVCPQMCAPGNAMSAGSAFLARPCLKCTAGSGGRPCFSSSSFGCGVFLGLVAGAGGKRAIWR